MSEITELLQRANSGDEGASGQLFTVLYGDLKRLAHSRLRGNGGGELNTTALVHESFLRLSACGAIGLNERPAFFSYVAKVMRSVILDFVREKQALKRGGDKAFVTLTTGVAEDVLDDARLVAIDDALKALNKLAPELHALVEMRYFAGLTVPEVSELTGKPVRTVEREWERGRALLRKLMEEA